jgi:hypothetical protein
MKQVKLQGPNCLEVGGFPRSNSDYLFSFSILHFIDVCYMTKHIPLAVLQMFSSRGSPLHTLLPTSSQLLSEPHYVPQKVPYPVIKGNENKFNKEIQDNQTI